MHRSYQYPSENNLRSCTSTESLNRSLQTNYKRVKSSRVDQHIHHHHSSHNHHHTLARPSTAVAHTTTTTTASRNGGGDNGVFSREKIRPRLVFIIRNGVKPRKSVRTCCFLVVVLFVTLLMIVAVFYVFWCF